MMVSILIQWTALILHANRNAILQWSNANQHVMDAAGLGGLASPTSKKQILNRTDFTRLCAATTFTIAVVAVVS